MDKIEWTFLLIGELSLPVPVGSAKQKVQFGKNHPTVTWGFKQIESIRGSVDKSKCQLAPPSLPDWWWRWWWWLLLKILSDLQINICSLGRDRKYLRTNNKIFRKLTIQHLLLTGFILNNLLKYVIDEYYYLQKLPVILHILVKFNYNYKYLCQSPKALPSPAR